MSILALVIATAVPLIVLYIIYTLDLYGTGSFAWIALCFVWGGIAVGLAWYANNGMVDAGWVDHQNLIRYVAPFNEEILKAIILVYLVRRPNFTYFVDGAIYGFAVGMGFAVFENYIYLAQNPGEELGLAISRVISTNLMHAAAASLVGITLGFSRFQRFSGRMLFLAGGLIMAIVFHAGYNNLVDRVHDGNLLLYAGVIGLVGAALIALVIKRGLNEQRAWIEETLGAADRVTRGEAAVVHRLADAHTILAPLAEIFGEGKADEIEKFLVSQARLGILRKTLQKLNDEKMRRSVEKQMDEIRAQMDDARRAVGAYTMMSLRSLFPEDDSPVWNRLEGVIKERAAAPKPAGGGALWASLGRRTTMRKNDPEEPGKSTPAAGEIADET